jgi:hypothetical protein
VSVTDVLLTPDLSYWCSFDLRSWLRMFLWPPILVTDVPLTRGCWSNMFLWPVVSTNQTPFWIGFHQIACFIAYSEGKGGADVITESGDLREGEGGIVIGGRLSAWGCRWNRDRRASICLWVRAKSWPEGVYLRECEGGIVTVARRSVWGCRRHRDRKLWICLRAKSWLECFDLREAEVRV